MNEDLATRSGLTGSPSFKVTTLKLKDENGASEWKLMSFGNDAPDPLPRYVQDIVGMRYITTNVNDLSPFLKRIKQHKVRLLGDTPIPLGSKGDMHFVLVSDPDGILIELIGPLNGR